LNDNAQAETHRNDQRRSRMQAIVLTAWDLARTAGNQARDSRARVMSLRTHERLRLLAEAELGVPKHKRSFLKVGEENQPGVLLIHDADQTPAHLVPAARALHKAGLTVHGQLLTEEGHDVTNRLEPRWRATLHQLRHGYQLLADSCNEVYVVGTGFGASLAMLLAEREKVAGLVLLAPAVAPRVGLRLKLMRSLGLLRLPAVRRRMGKREDVLEGMQHARDLAGKLELPVFAAMCDDDDVVSPEALRMLQRKCRHQHSRFRAFGEGGHDVLSAHGSSSLDADIIDFIKNRG